MRIDGAVPGAFVVAATILTACAADGPPPKAPEAKPIEVTAGAIHKEFRADAAAARAKYRGKVVQVSGVSGGQANADAFYLKETEDGPVIVTGFYYDSPAADQARLKAVEPNSKVVVTGRFDSFDGDKVELAGTRLVRVEK
jgi:hypothetical protein